MNTKSRRQPHAPVAAGFSLIELLVVIAIIALIISIIVPAVASARKSARKADTLNMCNGLSQACSQFILDQRRAPGYFTARDMGSADNISRGFTQMENAMLDLAGGIVGAGGKSYFTAKSKFFKEQDGTDGDGGNRKSTGANRDMPVLVDSEGCPILMWTVDDTARKEIRSAADLNEFARETSAGAAPARFYWASNSAFLGGNVNSASDPENFIGRRRVNQSVGSIIGFATAAHSANLGALLGNPNSPAPYSASATAQQIVPSAGRGTVIIQSAGPDGAFFGLSDRGAKRRTGGILYYGDNFVPGPTEDIAAAFDDVVLSGN
ncbi:MAG: prepilin-type N-terminal cleavage/methylation domain-containing protein [Planctomycetota bacterium]|nr:prepilin-type N-terminal cleavage/methylation domain-containing protein [Planctomycetota bacterium]